MSIADLAKVGPAYAHLLARQEGRFGWVYWHPTETPQLTPCRRTSMCRSAAEGR